MAKAKDWGGGYVIYVTDWKHEADEIVYITDMVEEADMVVFETNIKLMADKVVYATEHKSEADYLVMKTDNLMEVGTDFPGRWRYRKRFRKKATGMSRRRNRKK